METGRLSPHPTEQTSRPSPEMVRHAQTGDSVAFEAVIRYYRPAVLAMAISRTGDREAAEDLCQEILLRVWERIPGLHDPEAFPAWLRTLTLNACLSWHRRDRKAPLLSEDEHVEPSAPQENSPETLFLKREEQRLWRRVLFTLPENNRIPLLMHLMSGYSYAEIAGFLEVPVTTIEGRIHRAKVQLRRALKRDAAGLLREPRRPFKKE